MKVYNVCDINCVWLFLKSLHVTNYLLWWSHYSGFCAEWKEFLYCQACISCYFVRI